MFWWGKPPPCRKERDKDGAPVFSFPLKASASLTNKMNLGVPRPSFAFFAKEGGGFDLSPQKLTFCDLELGLAYSYAVGTQALPTGTLPALPHL